ncbi:MAG: Gfo/Idh/MocA family oxidoreductase [Phycisphaeraceae bacterium]|nr:Gfo/Idh/MocA family oxidoreductase [Phycisphaerae bacterium]MBX3392397.1 Gfo/Idh/MocA family oxidoreductase [Phycisphaeraceae bacterium]
MNPVPSAELSRREFVKAAGVSAVGAAALAVPAASALGFPGFFARGSDAIKVGLVGCGGRGTGAAMQALAADPGAILWSIGDVFEDRVNASHSYLSTPSDDMPEEYTGRVRVEDRRFTGFDAYKQVIDSGADVVLLCAYPCFRPAHLAYAVEKGKHVFAEKPVAVDAPGIRSVLESARRARERNLACLVGFCWRYNASMREAFKHVLGGTIGDITSVHTTYHSGTLTRHPRKPGWTDLEFQMRNWWHFNWISGDHIVEQAVHSVDRLAWAMRDVMPRSVQCLGGRAARSGPEHGDVFDHFSAIYDYADGTRCFHSCRQIDGCPSDNRDYVFGTKGNAIIDGWSGQSPMKARDGSVLWEGKGTSADVGRMYFDEHRELFASIRAGKVINDCEQATNSVMMAIMARMAAYTGQTITWEKALHSTQSLVPEALSFDRPAPEVVVAIPGQTKFT